SHIGGVVELECNFPPPGPAVAAPLHVVEWVRQGVDIPVLIKFGVYDPRVHPKYEGRVSLIRATALRVEALQLEDQGLYECRILLLDKPTDELHNGTWTLLSVTAPPIFTKTPPAVLEALVGSHLSVSCVANGNPTPAITWLKDGDVIQGINDEVCMGGTLSVRAVSMKSGGLYTCHASNSEGNVTRVMKLKIKGPPVIVIPPKSTSLNMSQNALLRCQAVADPPNMTYVWQKGGENVYHIESLKSRVKIMVDGTLLISSLIPEDSGNYTCIPTNGLLTPPIASANLTVMHPAQALQMPKETYLPTGMSGLVTCPVRAQPPLLRVDWTKDGEALDLALHPGWTLASEGSLFMATINDDASGVYTCTPYNSYGSMGSSEPTNVILQDPPTFSITPEKQYKQEVGRTLRIPCQGNGDPAINVTWSKVSPRSFYSVAANGSLLLRPLSKDHQGEWECSAANRVASVKASTHVLVLGTSPHVATSLSVSPGVKQANISWEAGFDGGSAQTFSVWWVKILIKLDTEIKHLDWFSVPVPPSSGTRLQVTGLSPATDYQFSVLSHNKVGTGPFSEIITTRTLDPPPGRGKLKPPVLLSANQSSAGVVLQWSLPTAQHPPITGFVLQSRTEQGEWFNLDEDISANSSEIIVPGLRKDCVYELRLLSRRGELLSEPSPSVNVSTIGMDIYPATSRLLEFVPEPLLAGVMGGVGFMCLALVLLLGSACVISHKRDQRRKKRKDGKNAPHSSSGSPDSVLKKSLLQNHTLYPTTSSTTTSSSQSDCSSFSKCSHDEYQNQRQHLMSTSHDPLNPTYNRGHLTRAASSPISPPLELISRGPDGRFIVQSYDHATQSVHPKRGPRNGRSHPASVQRSASLCSAKRERLEPPFVNSTSIGATYPILKSIGQPSTTASTLVLQMEHERETGNLSRCLRLAQEREELERELWKYTQDRSMRGELEREKPDMELERKRREPDGDEFLWKVKSSTLPHRHPHGGKRSWSLAQGPSSSSSVLWEAHPFLSPTTLNPSCCSSKTHRPPLSFTEQIPLQSEEADCFSKGRLTLPHPASKQHRSCGSLSTLSSHTYTERSNLTVSAVPRSSKAEILLTKPIETDNDDMCVEMCVDEPELEVCVMRPTKPMLHHRIASHVQEGHSLTHKNQYEDSIKRNTSFSCHSLTTGDFQKVPSSSLPPGSQLQRDVRQGSQNWDCKQRSKSLDFRRQSQSTFLTPDAWIDSLSQENCSTASSFQLDTLDRGPQGTPKTLKSPANPPSAAPSPLPHLREQTPGASCSFPIVEPLSPRSSPQKLIPNPSVPCHYEPSRKPSNLPDACRRSITYQEAQRSMEHMEAMKEASRCSLPGGTERGHRDSPRMPEATLYRGFSWPAPDQESKPLPKGKEVKWESEDEREEGDNAQHSGQGAEVEIGDLGGVPESGGSYSSYASSGRGSLEPANGRLSLCLSPTLTSSPETVEETQESTEDKDLRQTEQSKRYQSILNRNVYTCTFFMQFILKIWTMSNQYSTAAKLI
uniref:Immunoglobulin superfamily, member 9a n=1 Tax=Myripristis murdjan TaxID=586833 RepID=A0A668A8Q9_9TELE